MKLTEIRNLTFNFLSKSALAIAAVLLLLILYFLFSSYAFMLPNSNEVTMFRSISPRLAFVNLASALIVITSLFLLIKLPYKYLAVGSLAVFAIIGLYLVANNPADIRADAYWTFKAALDVSEGTRDSFLPPEGYMSVYPHQMSLMWFYYLGHQLWEGTKWVYYVNLTVAIITNILIWLIVKDLTRNLAEEIKRVSLNLAAILPVLFLPNLFMLNFGYNQVIGLFFFVLGFFLINKTFAVKDNRRYYYLFFSAIALIFAVMLRQNFLIGIIAVSLVIIVFQLKDFSFTHIIFAPLILVLAVVVPNQITYQSQSFLQVPHVTGFPTEAWVAMGLQDSKIDSIVGVSPSARLGGWYSNYPHSTHKRANYNQAKMKELARQDIKTAIEKRWNSPDHGLAFFSTKIKSTWGEPTYQSLFAGYVSEQKQQPTNAVLKFIYKNDRFTRVYTEFMRSVVAILIILTSISIYKIIRSKVRLEDFSILLVSVYLTGGFLFHLIWETKSLYAYPYVALLVIPASLAPVYLLRPKQPAT